MRRLGAVQQKIPCVFLTEVKEEQSQKRDRQQFQVVATETVNPVAVEANVDRALATEKLDGTCCYVTLYKGRPHLWARLDRKPNKQAEKRFRRHQHAHSCEGFSWSVEDDFKAVPETWIPAHRVRFQDGLPVPDPHGHIPGWVPLDKDNKQYCWHAAVVDAEARRALVLRPGPAEEDEYEEALEVAAVPLADLLEQTLELIGTNVNGNPYGLGSRKQPLHFLVSHGTVPIKAPPPLDLHRLRSWFLERPAGRVEGVVWHCDDGTLVKVHRHHLGLRWPDGGAALADRPVVVTVDDSSISNTSSSISSISMDLFTFFSRLNGHRFSRLLDIK